MVAGVFLFACKRKKESLVPQPSKSEVKEIQKHLPQVKIKRYEQALYSIEKDNLESGLKAMQKDYYSFLGDEPASPENLQQIKSYLNDKIIKQLYNESQKKFPDLTEMEKQFAEAFSLLLYHFPDANIPQIYTVITGLYYEEPIMYRQHDTTLVIALDLFLGKDYKLYKRLGADVPQYMRNRFSPEYILPNSMGEMAYQHIAFKPLQSNLLDAMILEGKRMLFMEMTLPNLPDSLIFPFSQAKIQWAKNNEANIWADFIQNNYLYSKDKKLMRKMVGEAAFTSYYGNNSPGRIGAWLGWRICRSWVEKNPKRKITELFAETDSQKILTEAKYKPQK